MGVPTSVNSVVFNGKTYQVDNLGFLDPAEQWDEGFADGMARTIGIPAGLSERHWVVIRYLRHRFVDDKTVPVVVKACADMDMRLAELRALFPTGYHRGACKIAGISNRFMLETNYWLCYETVLPLGPRYPLDPLGFLLDFERWDEWFAKAWFAEAGTTPTNRHWEMIRYLRDYYTKHASIPNVHEACSAIGMSLDEFGSLFPTGYRRGACLLAGLSSTIS
jgi:tRNA 2-thiouridine synthesizing protein E